VLLVSEHIEHARGDRNHVVGRQDVAASPEAIFERFADQELHHQERAAVLGGVVVQNGESARVVDPVGDVPLAQEPRLELAFARGLQDRVDFISEGIQTVNKKKFIFYEFESRVNGNKMKETERQAIFRYAYVQYYIGKDRTLVFTFSCPKDRKPEWQETVRAMMKTIKLK